MSPSTGVLHWMASHGRKAGILVRQVEDEIGVINMAIGAPRRCTLHVRDLGGGFALMTEASASRRWQRFPLWRSTVCAPVRPPECYQDRAGRSVAGAGRGLRRLPRVIAAPLDIGDCFTLMPEIFNITDKFQCPGIVLSICCFPRAGSALNPSCSTLTRRSIAAS